MIRLASAALLAAGLLNLSIPAADAGPLIERLKARRAAPITAAVPVAPAPVVPLVVGSTLPPVVGDHEGPSRGEKLLYRLARAKAVDEVMRTKNVSRAKAKELVDAVDDATLHAAAQTAGITIKATPPVGGPLTDFLDWLLANQDKIAALVKLILTLLAFI